MRLLNFLAKHQGTGAIVFFLSVVIGGIILFKMPNDRGQFIGFTIILIGFSIGSYSTEFYEVKNHLQGYLLSCLSIILTTIIVVYIRKRIFALDLSATFYLIAVATNRIITVVIKLIFGIPVKLNI